MFKFKQGEESEAEALLERALLLHPKVPHFLAAAAAGTTGAAGAGGGGGGGVRATCGACGVNGVGVDEDPGVGGGVGVWGRERGDKAGGARCAGNGDGGGAREGGYVYDGRGCEKCAAPEPVFCGACAFDPVVTCMQVSFDTIGLFCLYY